MEVGLVNSEKCRTEKMIEVRFLTVLREIAGERTAVIEKKESISLLIEYLCQRYGEKFRDTVIKGEKGALKEHVKIQLNGEEVNNPDTRIHDGSLVILFVPVAGG